MRPADLLPLLALPVSRRMVFHPGVTARPGHDADLVLDRPGAVLRGWTAGAGGRPLLYLGGNGEDVALSRSDLALRLPHHRSHLVAYRGYGASTGRPTEQALVADAVAVHDLVAARHPGTPVDVIGRSLGSGVAVQLAARRPVGRLVLVTPFDSVAAVADGLLPGRVRLGPLVRDRFDSAAVAGDVRAPVLVLRAGRDRVVPPPRTDALLDALPGSPTVADFPYAGHVDLDQDGRYWESITSFLDPGRDPAR
ncbi:MAG: alpha/beta hydrolase [Nocardioides sp.]|nr:alpha/beta hydrolase [Nocardioides sp.]